MNKQVTILTAIEQNTNSPLLVKLIEQPIKVDVIKSICCNDGNSLGEGLSDTLLNGFIMKKLFDTFGGLKNIGKGVIGAGAAWMNDSANRISTGGAEAGGGVFSKIAKGALRGAPLIGGVYEGASSWNEATEQEQTGEITTDEAVIKKGGAVGKGIGTLAGAEAGALLGAPLGPVGLITGGIVGGFIGSNLLGDLGETLTEKFNEFTAPDINKSLGGVVNDEHNKKDVNSDTYLKIDRGKQNEVIENNKLKNIEAPVNTKSLNVSKLSDTVDPFNKIVGAMTNKNENNTVIAPTTNINNNTNQIVRLSSRTDDNFMRDYIRERYA